MKKVLHSLALALVVALLGACGGSHTAPHLSTQAGLDSLRTILLDELGADATFLYFDFGSYDNTTDEFRSMTLTDSKQVHSMASFNWSMFSVEHGDADMGQQTGVRLADLDMAPIAKVVQEVERQVSERTSDFLRFYLHKVSVRPTAEGKVGYKVQVMAEKKDASPTKYGQRAGIDNKIPFFYFEADVAPDGTMSPIKGIPS